MKENIKILSNQTVNQMAAGEVVERPAHLVKELIENSLDAKATSIEVVIDDGGQFVQVIDNGAGIQKNDLALALTPHATNKISCIEDLWKLHSFGFRGEALASISSISDCKVSSFFEGQKKAYSIDSSFGAISSPQISGNQIGTTVVIKNLFKNLPARLKFLKSPAAEVTKIKAMFKALALSYSNVSFKLKTKKELVFLFSAQKNSIDRVKEIFSLDFIYEANYKDEEFTVQAWYASPEHTQKTSKQIWIFVQDRWVKDRALQKAITDAYRQFLMHGEYPMVVLKVFCKPEDIDINIHPSKAEVKFQNPGGAYKAVLRALRSSIERAPWLQDILKDKGMSTVQESSLYSSSNYSVKKNSQKIENLSFKSDNFLSTQYNQLPKHNTVVLESETNYEPISVDCKDDYKKDFVKDSSNSFNKDSKEKLKWKNLQVLTQVDSTYIVTQSNEAIIFIDQHAAHERVLFERLYKNWKASKIVSQNLLIPIELKFSKEKNQLLFEYKNDLKKLGVFLKKIDNTITLAAVPQFIKESSILEAFSLMLEELEEQSDSFVLEQKISHIFATMACHSAIRAGKILNIEQMKDLLVQMDENQSSFCPHGRPVFVKYPFSKLEKDFGRTV
ncbi:MAG: DNA mismatch repair endonuclease MutL [Bdellovibrionaceae bacterium]|nr:DNA mismatch repair endonuclease MutL [Pseudobdellovibrionaceae bacterium]